MANYFCLINWIFSQALQLDTSSKIVKNREIGISGSNNSQIKALSFNFQTDSESMISICQPHFPLFFSIAWSTLEYIAVECFSSNWKFAKKNRVISPDGNIPLLIEILFCIISENGENDWRKKIIIMLPLNHFRRSRKYSAPVNLTDYIDIGFFPLIINPENSFGSSKYKVFFRSQISIPIFWYRKNCVWNGSNSKFHVAM